MSNLVWFIIGIVVGDYVRRKYETRKITKMADKVEEFLHEAQEADKQELFKSDRVDG